MKIGENVKGFKLGDKVTADNSELCGYCHYCRQGKLLYCENFVAHGVHSRSPDISYEPGILHPRVQDIQQKLTNYQKLTADSQNTAPTQPRNYFISKTSPGKKHPSSKPHPAPSTEWTESDPKSGPASSSSEQVQLGYA